MLARGCAWLRSRCAPLTAAAASLLGRGRLRRNAGLCLTGGMRGVWRKVIPAPLAIADDAEALKSLLGFGKRPMPENCWHPWTARHLRDIGTTYVV
jgi:hypothetical protein